MIKCSVHQKDISNTSKQAPNIRALKYIKHIPTDLKDTWTAIQKQCGSSIPHFWSWIDHPEKKHSAVFFKETLHLNYT